MMVDTLALGAVLMLVLYALHGYSRKRNKLDLFYAIAMLPWAALIALSLLVDEVWLSGSGRGVTLLIHQFTIVGLSAFLLQGVDGLKRPQEAALWIQAGLGCSLAAIPLAGQWWNLGSTLPEIWDYSWVGVNAVFAVLVLIRLILLVWRKPSPEGWMVLLVTIVGLGFIIGDVRSTAAGFAEPSVSDYFFSVALLVLWLILTRRTGATASKWQPGNAKTPAAHQQLAQDLHDGVGAQLTSIIAGLEIGTPQQRATAMALQHCLLELKMLVDGEGQDISVIEHLACLRYRIQPMLQSAGIEMVWEMSDEEELEQFHGDSARQVLRVAQEALANVVRHSEAYEVIVTCRYERSEQALVLEVSDNGIGIPPELQKKAARQGSWAECGRHGKGLGGMAWRARKLGAELLIDAVRGGGTRVRLLLPVDALTEVEP